MPKNIALCFDGTWDKPLNPKSGKPVRFDLRDEDSTENPSNTNVVKITRLMGADRPGQIVLYFNGVSTQWFDPVGGGIIGAGLDALIKLGCQRLAEQYEPGDKIFLFGFSRGAYTARSLGGMIRKCGVLRRECLANLDAALDLYRRRDEPMDSNAATAFRRANSYETNIHFMGVWDTVGELGIPLAAFNGIDNEWCGFHDTSLSATVENGFQALAIDENRKSFAPTLWTGQPAPWQAIEQRWFIGTHANVGGGFYDDRLSNITLAWMCKKAASCGLQLSPFISDATDYLGGLHASYAEFIGGLNFICRWFHSRYYRPIHFGDCCQTLDRSAVYRLNLEMDYAPRNLKKFGPPDTLMHYVPANDQSGNGVAMFAHKWEFPMAALYRQPPSHDL